MAISRWATVYPEHCHIHVFRLKEGDYVNQHQIKDVKLYIDGAFISAEKAESFENRNPFTNEVTNHVAKGEEADIIKAVEAADNAFHHGEWGKMTLKERMTYID